MNRRDKVLAIGLIVLATIGAFYLSITTPSGSVKYDLKMPNGYRIVDQSLVIHLDVYVPEDTDQQSDIEVIQDAVRTIQSQVHKDVAVRVCYIPSRITLGENFRCDGAEYYFSADSPLPEPSKKRAEQ